MGNWRIRRKAHPLYLQACRFFSCTLIDRTGMLDCGLPFRIIDPIGTLETGTKSFDRICEERAASIVAQSTGRRITVLWSGGIDSTVALIALRNCLGELGEKHRLHVLLSKESITEFPGFFRDEIDGRLDYSRMQTNIYDAIRPEDINVTGEHGDQLFGSDKLKYAVQTGQAFRPYPDVLFYYISRKLGTTKHSESLIRYLQPQVDAAPVAIRTYYDYLWWMNFSLKWQYVSLRLRYGLDPGKYELGDNLIHFFRAPDFQAWSLANPDQKIRRAWPSYKFIAKEFIHRHYPNEDYLLYKEKEQSLKEVIVRSGSMNWKKILYGR
ncbi:hypothetical protein CRP01_06565 [Flavilitoribacter nigricans DSM 23189 = NBRC 102662]|uniref:Asparagine synthetase domain-containing protein n=2 Tax=Flavilitoribacter TaxID=2762562 RepID=A0A2D0NFU9_FLAN2|nr:hypothetical protein CRP01_06565 [Flavilitoribacter nigricans DSM 23189 = NBRC 102662]